MRVRALFYVLVLLILHSCGSSSQSVRYDYSYLYQEDQNLIKPKVKVYHKSADSSNLYFQINSNDLLYGRLGSDSSLTSRVLCKYKVYGRGGKDIILDSATIPLVSIGENAANKLLQANISMKVTVGDLYPLELKFRDEYRDINVVYYYWIDKRLNGNNQFYLIKQEQQIVEATNLKPNETYVIEKSPLIDATLFDLMSSNYAYEMTPPPFATGVNYPPPPPADTSRVIEFVNHKVTLKNTASMEWMKPRNDTSLRALYMYSYHPAFPDIGSYEQMVDPIRYISTSSEFKKIKEAINLKKEIDNFWLKMGGDIERAKRMIAEYYRRVELANRNFTSFREGWKTDRGIIFVVYGEPNTIYKDLNREIWVYGEENNILSIKFEFKHIDNPVCTNDYQLIRESDFKNNWYRAVDSWRQAKVY